MYLQPTDYQKNIRQDILQIVTNGNENLLLDAEMAAIVEMSGYLNSRFDLELIFLRYNPFTNTQTYIAGNRVLYQNSIYEAKQNIEAKPFDSSDWILLFEKNPLITMLLVDITLYHLHSRISPKEVPIVRLDRYNSAIKYLQKIASGELNPMLPLAPANNSERDESVIKFGDKGKFSVRNSRYF